MSIQCRESVIRDLKNWDPGRKLDDERFTRLLYRYRNGNGVKLLYSQIFISLPYSTGVQIVLSFLFVLAVAYDTAKYVPYRYSIDRAPKDTMLYIFTICMF